MVAPDLTVPPDVIARPTTVQTGCLFVDVPRKSKLSLNKVKDRDSTVVAPDLSVPQVDVPRKSKLSLNKVKDRDSTVVATDLSVVAPETVATSDLPAPTVSPFCPPPPTLPLAPLSFPKIKKRKSLSLSMVISLTLIHALIVTLTLTPPEP